MRFAVGRVIEYDRLPVTANKNFASADAYQSEIAAAAPGAGPHPRLYNAASTASQQILDLPLEAAAFDPLQFTNRRSRTLFTSPSIKKIDRILDPPALISGSGTPVTGILPTTIPTFTNT